MRRLAAITTLLVFVLALGAHAQDATADEPGPTTPPETVPVSPTVVVSDGELIFVVSERALPSGERVAVIDAVIPPDGEKPALTSRVRALTTMPAVATADRGTLILGFAPNPGSPVFPVRALETRRISKGPVVPGAARARPPLPQSAAPLALTVTDTGLLALVVDPGTETVGLSLLRAGRWRAVELPPDLVLDPTDDLLTLQGGAVLVNAAKGRLISIDLETTRLQPTEPESSPVEEQGDEGRSAASGPEFVVRAKVTGRTDFEARADATPIVLADQLALVTLDGNVVSRRTLIAGRLAPEQTVTLEEPHTAVIGLGQRLAALVLPELPDAPPAPTEDLVMTVTLLDRAGDVVASGAVQPFGLFDVPDLALFLVVVVAGLASMVLVIIHVIAAPRVAKPGYGLDHASPSRRMLASLMDLMLGFVLASPVHGLPVTWWTGTLEEIADTAGGMPILTALGLTIAICAVGEATAGVTPGKLLLGIQTVRRDGGRPGPMLAFVRSLAKVVCPAAILWTILRPDEPHPAAFGTFVVRRGVRPPPPQAPSDTQDPPKDPPAGD